MNENRQYHLVPVPGQEPAPDVWVLATQDELEYMKAVSDAIILERAARVLRRRHDLRDIKALERISFTVRTLEAEAQSLRQEAESGA